MTVTESSSEAFSRGNEPATLLATAARTVDRGLLGIFLFLDLFLRLAAASAQPVTPQDSTVPQAMARSAIYITAGFELAIVDSASKSVIATVATGGHAVGVAVPAHGRAAYVAVMCADSECEHCGGVAVIDTLRREVTATIPIEDPSDRCRPSGIAITPDGRFLYVTSRTSTRAGALGIVAVIDTASDQIVARIPAGEDPGDIAISPDGRYAYVANIYSGTLTRIDTATKTVTAQLVVETETITAGLIVGPGTLGALTISPNGRFAYVATGCPNSEPHCDYSGIGVIDLAKKKVMKLVRLRGVGGIAVTSDGKKIYVSTDLAIRELDLASLTLTRSIPIQNGAGRIVLTSGSRFAYAGGYMSDRVAVIDTVMGTVVKYIPVAAHTFGVAIGKLPIDEP